MTRITFTDGSSSPLNLHATTTDVSKLYWSSIDYNQLREGVRELGVTVKGPNIVSADVALSYWTDNTKEDKMNLVAQDVRKETEKRVAAEVMAEATKSLAKYPGPTAECPKCGQKGGTEDLTVLGGRQVGVKLRKATEEQPEHLEWNCNACGHVFATKTKGA